MTTNSLQKWDIDDVATWTQVAVPSSRMAMWLLAHGLEMSTQSLNFIFMSYTGFGSSKGAVIGGIKAYAAKLGLMSPVTYRFQKGTRVYAMKKDLQWMFLRFLKNSHEAGLLQIGS